VTAFGAVAVAEATGVPRSALAKVARGWPATTRVPHYVIVANLKALWAKRQAEQGRRQDQLQQLRDVVEAEGGVRAAARKLGIDPSNLSKHLRRSGGA